MTWLQFIAEMTSALAWPIVLIVALIVLGKPLRGLLGKIQALSYGDARAEFRDQLAQSEELQSRVSAPEASPDAPIAPAPSALPEPEPATEGPAASDGGPRAALQAIVKQLEDMGEFARVARDAPALAVGSAWHLVERALIEAGRIRGLPFEDLETTTMDLRLAGAMNSSVNELVHSLKRTRDAAFHDPNAVSVSEAIRFRELAETVVQNLRNNA